MFQAQKIESQYFNIQYNSIYLFIYFYCNPSFYDFHIIFHTYSLLISFCLQKLSSFRVIMLILFCNLRENDTNDKWQHIASLGVCVISRRLWLVRQLPLFSIERLTCVSFLLSALFVDWNKARSGRIFAQTGEKDGAREFYEYVTKSKCPCDFHASRRCTGCLPVSVKWLQNASCYYYSATIRAHRNLV